MGDGARGSGVWEREGGGMGDEAPEREGGGKGDGGPSSRTPPDTHSQKSVIYLVVVS